MRVIACPSDRKAVGWYRLGLPMSILQADKSIQMGLLPGLPLNTHEETGAVLGLKEDFDCDVLVLQRPFASWQVIAMKDAQKRGIAVVVELDDDFHAMEALNRQAMQLQPQHIKYLGDCCKAADMVTCSTPALVQRYAPHGRGVTIPNFVSSAWLGINLDPRAPRFERPVVGWTGTVVNHHGDLRATHGGVAMATREHEATLRVVGRGDLENDPNYGNGAAVAELGGDVEVVPWQDFDAYPHKVAEFDVGIAPLADTAFNRAKSWLKPLEMAALGVPCVMSPTDEYRWLNSAYGIGVLAGYRSREWKREVGKLLADDSYRADLAVHGREQVREHLTMDTNAWQWAEAWQGAIDNRRRKASQAVAA